MEVVDVNEVNSFLVIVGLTRSDLWHSGKVLEEIEQFVRLLSERKWVADFLIRVLEE